VLAIPHNGNLSNGRMFGLVDFEGMRSLAPTPRPGARLEPVYEVTQIRGDGESHQFLSPNDEFAGYRSGQGQSRHDCVQEAEMLQYEYARSALKLGLKLEQQLGINPYKFGMIGSTDSHTSSPRPMKTLLRQASVTSRARSSRSPLIETPDGKTRIMDWGMVASGYAAVWATENTRAAIFDALMRKEVYATTGPRMVVRFFGGFNFQPHDAQVPDLAAIGYAKGVPMGGDLSNAPQGNAPSFLLAAMKDPIGANLDRIQIVKGWEDAQGGLQEKVYDVAWSDPQTRKPGADGKLPAVGNTVNVPDASYTNSIGTPELVTVWTDPDFDATLRAFYYGRVIAIPTPRWTAYDAKHFGVTMPQEVPMTTQERAYTSPIWYTPRG
jgi:hypothetical protein